jgi:CCR4-NOT transcription complex subunit 6
MQFSSEETEWLNSSHWQEQIQLAQLSRQTNAAHSYARSAAMASRISNGSTGGAIGQGTQGATNGSVPSTVLELAIQFVQQHQQPAAQPGVHTPVKGGAAASVNRGGHGRSGAPGVQHPQQGQERMEDERQRRINEEINKQFWTAIDLSGQGISRLTPKLFNYTFLQKLFLNHNKLTVLPPSITKLKQLKVLDLSDNMLTELPAEVGLLFNLKYLMLFDNQLQGLPFEIGSLFQLEVLGLEGNPLNSHTRELLANEGSKGVIVDLRERAPVKFSSPPREWLVLDGDDKGQESGLSSEVESRAESRNEQRDSKDGKSDDNPGVTTSSTSNSTNGIVNASGNDFSIMSYNTLCDKYATPQMYGYTPSWALGWKYRSELLKEEIIGHSATIICLQEIDRNSFEGFWTPELGDRGYKGAYWPKTRARTMNETDSRKVDGCATYYKSSEFKLLEKVSVEYNAMALRRDDFKKTEDVYNRVMNKDEVALITVFEHISSGSPLIVANTHVQWDPQFCDVKIVEVALLLEEVEKLVTKYASNSTPEGSKYPKYSDPKNIPTIITGDYNSTFESGVYALFGSGKLSPKHPELEGRTYGKYTEEGVSHKLQLKSAYADIGELSFTNYTPNFVEVIDWMWYTTPTLRVKGLLGSINSDYVDHYVGFPNSHHPSDHIPILAKFGFRKLKEGKPGPAKFPSSKK